MVNIRIPFHSAHAQSSFPFANILATKQPLSFSFAVKKGQAHNAVQCDPSVSHELLWALDGVMAGRFALGFEGLGLVV